MRCRQRHALRHDGQARELLGVVVCVCVAVLGARPALAEGALIPTRLTYSAVKGCPDERAYRTAVIGYLGARDPFTIAAVQRLDVHVKRVAGRYVAETVIVDAEGKSHRDRNQIDDPQCAPVVEAAAYIVTPWLQLPDAPPKPLQPAEVPAAVAPPAPAPPPAGALLAPPQAAPVAKPPPRRPPREAAGLYVGGDVLFNPILAPIGSAGGSLWLALRLRQPAMSIELGLRGLGSLGAAQELYPSPSVYVGDRWTYVSGVVAATAHVGPVFFGPMFEVGRLTPRTDASSTGLETLNPLALSAGVRAGVAAAVADGISVRSLIEGEWVAVGQPVDARSSHFVQSAPSFSATVAIGLAFQLWSPGERSR